MRCAPILTEVTLLIAALYAAPANAQIEISEERSRTSCPRLVVDWSDGVRREWVPDAPMTCTGLSGEGPSRNLQMGNKRSTILIFPFEARQGATVRRARLVLVSDKQFVKLSQIDVFRLYASFAIEIAAKSGLAAGFVLDEGITSHSAAVFATGFESRSWVDGWFSIGRGSKAQPVARDDANRFAPLYGNALKVTVEQCKRLGLKLNTPGRNDGILSTCVDGVPVFGRTDIRFRDPRDLRIETLWMNVYHVGITDAPQDLSLYIDNLVVAADYNGPAGGVRSAAAR